MPHYDESFIYDDNQNQRRNKRSYRVYKSGVNSFLEPSDVLHALEERGSSVIKRNIRNIKQRGHRYKPDPLTTENIRPDKRTGNVEIVVGPCPRFTCYDANKYYDFQNNNILTLTPCKSFDNLTLSQVRNNDVKEKNIRNGISLQNLVDEEGIHHYVSTNEESSSEARKGEGRNSYSVADARRRPMQRRVSRGTAAPGVGIYRQIINDGTARKVTHEGDGCGEAGSGHRGSLRGANKLARRARSFKDDLLERISNMRSPAQQHHPPHLSSAMRSHSPLSPKIRNMASKTSTADDGDLTPAKELEGLVKEVTFGLKHFSDVITKRKLEMLPDNGTIVFESIANIHKAIKPYSGRSPSLLSAVKRLCNALAMLIKLCDEIAAVSLRADAGNEEMDASALSKEHVSTVVKGVTSAVEEVAALAQQHMTRPALSPRPALVSPRASTQRNSLPDIPLTPKERSLLTGDSGSESTVVRASHSSESVLDAPDSPPPKPARPNRKMELAPPLPPKRRSANENSLIAQSIDRLSLQSHSSGSLDSMLNVSNEEDRNAHDSNSHERVFVTPPTSDLVGICSCNSAGEMRVSIESQDSHANSIHVHSQSNHNRYVHHFSNESGFASQGQAEMSTEHSFSSTFASHHYSTHTDSNFESTVYVNEVMGTRQSIESFMNVHMTNATTHQSISTTLPSITSDDSETPPELPVKTRRSNRADVQQSFPTVEIRQSPVCSLHGEARPHTLAEHHPSRPPPLPLKKKHSQYPLLSTGKRRCRAMLQEWLRKEDILY